MESGRLCQAPGGSRSGPAPSAPASSKAVIDPTWVPRMVGIVLGLLFGVIALLALAGAVAGGQAVAAGVSLLVAVVLLGGATALILAGRRPPA